VIAIEPGPIKTPIWDKAKAVDLAAKFPNTDYDAMLPSASDMIKAAEKSALPVEQISKLIYKILTVKRPKTRYMVHHNKLGFNVVRKLVPTRLVDKIIKRSIFDKGGSRPF